MEGDVGKGVGIKAVVGERVIVVVITSVVLVNGTANVVVSPFPNAPPCTISLPFDVTL